MAPELFHFRKRPGKSYFDRLKAEAEDRSWEGATPIADSGDIFYRPGELLLNRAAAARFRDELARSAKPDPRRNEELAELGLDLVVFNVGRRPVPRIVDGLRRLAAEEPGLVVSANTVLRGEPWYEGGPGSAPAPAEGFEAKSVESASEGHDIAVLDTGVWEHWNSQSLLTGGIKPDADDNDLLDVDGTLGLDTQAAHGTFIAGLVRQHAPELMIDPGKVLDSTGFGDDLSIALELSRKARSATSAPVINMSLGGYTQDDRPPPALAAMLEAVWPEHVVVAAAGNNASDRPFWPAAFKRVIAVGALDTTGVNPQPAKFSNFGPWVDVWAPGVDLVSTYVDEQMLTDPVGEGFTGWASWSGTSFAAPLVASELARRVKSGIQPQQAALDFLLSLKKDPAIGLVYLPGDVVLR